jgi:hypothetical protein
LVSHLQLIKEKIQLFSFLFGGQSLGDVDNILLEILKSGMMMQSSMGIESHHFLFSFNPNLSNLLKINI